MGWIVINDRNGALKGVKQGLHNVTGRILGPNSTVQHALEEILKNTPQIFFDKTVEKIAVSKLFLIKYIYNQSLVLAPRTYCLQTFTAITRTSSNQA